jgi:hypothetical protein
MRGSMLALLVIGCGGSTEAPATAPDACSTCKDATGVDSIVVDSAADDATDAAADAATDTSETGGIPTVPPKRPKDTGTGTTKWFAFDTLQLGLKDRATGKPDTSAWMQYGYDLDGRNTSKSDSATSKESCMRVAGSATGVLTDGYGGIDNNFGSQIMPLIKAFKTDAEEYTNQGIQDGSWTLLLRLDNVGPDDNASVPGAVYVGHSLGGTPKFDGTDHWTVATETTLDGTIDKPRIAFPGGYMAGGTWVSGDFGKGTVPVALVMFGVYTIFPLEHGIVTVRVSDGANGTIAGGTATTDLVEAFQPVVKSFGICPGSSTYDVMQMAVKQSSDLVSKAASLNDPTKTCDAISSGLGFTMKPTGVPTTVAPVPPAPPDACP